MSLDDAARGQTRSDYTHIAFDVAEADFDAFARALCDAGVRVWKQNRSEGQSVYFLDPDGHKLEIHVGSLQSRLAALQRADEQV